MANFVLSVDEVRNVNFKATDAKILLWGYNTKILS